MARSRYNAGHHGRDVEAAGRDGGWAVTTLSRPRLVAVSLLGVSAGLPLALSDSTLQAWLTVAGVDVASIGLLSLVGLPYVFKFLWAPLVDRYSLGWPGRRRDWILACQLLLAALLAGAGLADLASLPLLVVGLVACAIATVSATQDIAIDAWRSEVLAATERGLGAALYVGGYRVAMLLAGAGALVLADQVGFAQAYLVLAALMLLCGGVALAAPAPAAAPPAPRTFVAAVREPLEEFFHRDGAVALLALVVLYKLGDAFAGRLTMNFLLDELDFSLTDVGTLYKGLGLVATLTGALYGGALMVRLGLYRALLLFAWLQAVTNLGFVLLAAGGASWAGMVAVIALENLSGGMGTAAFVALLMAACTARYAATQFALLSAVASLARVLAGPPSGYLVETAGWVVFFTLTFLFALPAIVVIRRCRARLEALDTASP